ncbi:MAG: hypothetical protein ABH860_04755 [bacterium]
MKKVMLLLACLLMLSLPSFCSVYSYSFPKAPAYWGKPVSFNNLSPGFFQVMYVDAKGVIRIATYGIAGGSMDALKDPQFMMLFAFDKEEQRVGLKLND